MQDIREHLARLQSRLDDGTLSDTDQAVLRRMIRNDAELNRVAALSPKEKAAEVIARKFPRLVEPPAKEEAAS